MDFTGSINNFQVWSLCEFEYVWCHLWRSHYGSWDWRYVIARILIFPRKESNYRNDIIAILILCTTKFDNEIYFTSSVSFYHCHWSFQLLFIHPSVWLYSFCGFWQQLWYHFKWKNKHVCCIKISFVWNI